MSEVISLGSGDTLGNSGTAGKVGIGTTTPNTKLQIKGSKTAINFEVDDDYPRIQFSNNSPVIDWPTDKNLYLGETTNTGGVFIRAAALGIGLSGGTLPAEKLEVNGRVKTSSNLWQNGGLVLGSYYLWVDSNGRLRIKNGAPTSETDGVSVGSQS